MARRLNRPALAREKWEVRDGGKGWGVGRKRSRRDIDKVNRDAMQLVTWKAGCQGRWDGGAAEEDAFAGTWRVTAECVILVVSFRCWPLDIFELAVKGGRGRKQ